MRGITRISKKGALIVITVPFFVSPCFSQVQHKTDSTLRLLKSQNLHGSELLDTIYTISKQSTNPNRIISYANGLINEAEKQDNYEYLVLGYTDLGYGLKLKGELDDALEVYLKAAQIASENNDPIREGDVYTNIAGIYTTNEDYKKSLESYEIALSLYKNQDVEPNRLAGVYTNYGYAAYKTQFYDSAISLSQKAIEFSKASTNKILVAYSQANMALALAKTEKFEEAEKQLNDAIEIMKANSDHYGLSDCLIEMGGIYLEQGDVTKAMSKLKEGYKIALDHGLKQQIQNGAKFLFMAHQQLGNLEMAIEYQSKYYAYRDSIINAEQIRKLANLETEFEVGQKQAEVDLLTEQKKVQRIVNIAISVGAVLMIALLVVVYKSYRDKNQINKMLEDQKAQLETLNNTKDKFFSIVSHDLRGPVTAFRGISRLIKHAVETNDHDELNEIADHIDQTSRHLSGLLDNLLTWAMQQQGHFPNVPEKLQLKEITEEIKGIFSAMAEGKEIALKIESGNGLVLWSDKNSTMTILRNLVNNALKFTPNGGEVRLIAQEENGNAKIEIRDTGIGMSQKKVDNLFKMDGEKTSFGTAGEKGLGLGLQLVNEFVAMNNGHITVSSEKGKGTTFTIRLPLFESTQQEITS